jgi:hypothetical protein
MPPVKDAESKFEAKGRFYAPFEVKAVDEGERTFNGLASVWDLDLGDDKIQRGAFKKSLAEWRESKTAMPLLNSHNHFDIMAALGQMLEAKETKAGLDSDWEIIEGADGDQTLIRLQPSKRTGRAVVGSMSIGYEAVKFDFEENDEARFGLVRNLREVKLREVSLVLFPMAPGALINVGSVKAMIDRKVATPEELDYLRKYTTDLDALLKSAGAPAPPELVELVDEPDTTMLDRLRLQQLRL